MNPHHRVVILTGATQGIGRATAYTLAESGCRLALVARHAMPLQQLAHELHVKGGVAVAIPTDMGEPDQATDLVRKTTAIFGKLDVVINNAGIGVYGALADLNEAEARRVMEVNYFGPVALMKAALPALKANPDGGLIINVSSIIGRRSMPNMGGYCATKGALERMAESLRLEVKSANIRVSTVYPGVTRTPFATNSLGKPTVPLRNPGLRGAPPAWVAQAILETIRNERRDVFITWLDRAFVLGNALLPSLMDRILLQYQRLREIR